MPPTMASFGVLNYTITKFLLKFESMSIFNWDWVFDLNWVFYMNTTSLQAGWRMQVGGGIPPFDFLVNIIYKGVIRGIWIAPASG